jgi:aarF domain-containing kinase
MATAAAPRFTGASTVQITRQEGYVTLFQVWKAWRLKEFDSQLQGMKDFSYRKFQDGLYWRPAVFVSLADKKGQVLLQSLALLAGEAWRQRQRAPAAAEQLHGNWELTSQTQESSLKSVLKETVEAILLWIRVLYLLALFTPSLLVGSFVDQTEGRLRRFWLRLLLWSLEAAGPAFIKWGQWASTRPDIFPADVCDELSRLHMQAPKHTFAETRKIMQKAFRVPIEAIFDEFEPEPVASGSIAQIHRAVLKKPPGNGPPITVAVKVRHPKVHDLLQRDFVIIRYLANISTMLPGLKHLQLDKTVQHFAAFMTRQVDLTLEAAHLQRFIYNFRKSKDVSFPTPIYPLVHPTVLVETYEEGLSVSKYVNSGPLTKIHSRLAYIGSSCLLKMMLQDNFIHGDLHPGNIFVRFVNNVPKVVLLDVGMTAELNAHSRSVMLDLFKAIAFKNGRDVATYTLQFTDDQTCPDPEAFKNAVDAKFKEYLSIRGTAKNTGECMTELFDQIRQHRVNMDGDVCTVMVTTLILEGWQRKLDPDLDLFKMLGELLTKAEYAVSFDYTISAIAAP